MVQELKDRVAHRTISSAGFDGMRTAARVE